MASRLSYKVLWAAALAVLIQLGAPIWAVAMLAAEATDPLAGMAICSHDGASSDSSAPHSNHGSVCAICQFAAAGQFVLTRAPIAVAPAEIGCVSHIRHSIAEPRAPPPLYAQARAPPASF